MYAAAGGASIAKRRQQKRLQQTKQRLEAIHQAGPKKSANTITGPRQKPRTHLLAPQQAQQSTCCNHAHGHNRRRRTEKLTPNRFAPPVSPIFPISPPPLSLESQNSVALNKSSNFPFPPPSFLDLRSPSPNELQCGGQGPGKAAWQGCSRPSPLPLSPASPHGSRDGYKTKQCEAHRRWMKRNRIRDASYCYGSSGEDDDDDGSSLANRRRGEVNAAFNTVLYAGLGTTALGLVISFVGTGEKGFLSPELRLVGPTLLCAGLLCCLLRVLLCICLCRCCGDCRWTPCRVVIVDKDKMKKLEPTATLLPQPTQPTIHPIAKIQKPINPQKPPIGPIASSSRSTPAKVHELLLSPAQLPE